jgi:hypothetical protein
MPQQIDVPGMGIIEFPDGMDDAAITSAIQKNMPAPEKPFFEKLGNFARNVYNNPPPTVAGIRDVIKGAPAAATELTYGADPEAAREAAGTMLGAAGLGVTGPRGLQFPAPKAPAPLPTNAPLEAAGRLGVDVPRYLATEGTAVPRFAQGVGNVPWAGEPVINAAKNLTEGLGTAKSGIAGSATLPESAGLGARAGIEDFVKTGSRKPVSEAYDAVDSLMKPGIRAPLNNTAEMVGQIMAERTQARIPGQSKAVQTVFDAVQDPRGMDYAGTKGLRSFLGEKTPQQMVAEGISPIEHKRLYGALSKDLENIAQHAGGEAGLSAWQEANTLARITKTQQRMLANVIGPKADMSPEAVFGKLAGYAGGTSKADLSRLALARQAMGPAAWRDVGSAMINRLGADNQGGFSADRFVTAFNKLSPGAKNILFDQAQLAALNDLATVSAHVQNRITRFSNPSGTARSMFGGGAAFGVLSDPVSTIGGALGTRLTAHMLARPAVARAAANVQRAQLRADPRLIRAAQAQLAAAIGNEERRRP